MSVSVITARAATFTVTSTADDGSAGTLRAAFADAQASTDVHDTITITAQGTILLANGELLLSNPNAVAGKTVTIQGPGAGALFVSGGHAPNTTGTTGSRVFHFSGLTVHMSGLAAINGFVNIGSQGGSGILQEGGALTLDHGVVEDCLVNLSTAFGGGIANVGGALILTHCVVTSNGVSAFSGVGGSGIGSQSGSLTLTDCTVDNNSGSGLGGGIGSVSESLTLTRCVISDNSTLNTNGMSAYGGGVYTQNDTVMLTDCSITGNASSSAGDGLYLKYGSATLRGCTISANQTGGGLIQSGFQFPGGGLYIGGTVVALTNCTVTGNSADLGGGIYNQGTLTLSDSTVARNSGGSASGTTGAGLYAASGSTATVTSSLLGGNSTFGGESDVFSNGGTVTSGGSNLLGDPDGNGFTNSVGHDQTGVTNSRLGPLSDNDGPTPTLALLPGSPAIDADYADATSTDQRGATRPVGARNDSGAYEYGASAMPNVPDTFVVTNTNNDGDGSLRRAVNNADADPGAHIVFDPSVFGIPRTITLTGGALVVRQSMTIEGPGQKLLTVSGNHASVVLNIEGGAHAISGLTITDGHGTTGGGVFDAGPLTMTDCTITGNTAGGQDSVGGGLFVQGNATLTRCTITNNTAPNGSSSGGGVCNLLGTLTLTDCTVAGNSAAQGGGVFTTGGFATLNTCTLSGNSASMGGGAYTSGILVLTNCTVSGNMATSGGGLYSSSGGLILLNAATVSANTAGTGSGLDNESGATALASGTILAGNRSSANVANNGGTITSEGSNLVGDPDGNGFANDPDHANPSSTGNHDQTGVTDPHLGPLKDNGGPTQTMALLNGSPAIDANFFTTGGTDQRGATRPVGARNDSGAYEYGAVVAVDDAYTVTKNATLTVSAPGVLANDAPDGSSSLTAAVQTPPTHGQLTLDTTGAFTYMPDSGFLGTDTFTYQAQGAGGQTSVATVTLTVTLLQPPTTAASLRGTQGRSGYYRSAVTVTLTPSDPSNGAGGSVTTRYTVDGGAAQTYSGPFTVSGDGAHTVTFSSAGAQSGTGPSGSVRFKIDATPPTLTFGIPAPAANASGYTNASVRIPYTAADATSGVASSAPGSPVLFTSEGPHQTRIVTVADNAGNSATFTTRAVSIDLTPPVTTVTSQSTTMGQQVTLAATDALSGVASTTYTVDGAAAVPYSKPFMVRGNGPHTVMYSSKDKAGNVEATKKLTFTIDIAAPITTATLSGPQGANGWYKGAVTVTLTAKSHASTVSGTFYKVDDGAQRTYTGPFTVSGDKRHTVTYFSTDVAGNTEAANRKPVLIDGTPPTTTASITGTKNSTGAYVGTATVALTAIDALSGVARTTYTLDGKAAQTYATPFDVAVPGKHTLTFGSTDKAGNAETMQTITVTIAAVTPPVLHTFPAGLQMFAVPESYAAMAKALSPTPARLAVWDPTLLQYTLPNGTTALTPGQGYWARFAQATDLSDTGTPTPTSAPARITLKRGWNMIGDPFPVSVSLSSAPVTAGGKTYRGLSDASKAGVTAFTLYGYPAGSTRYQIQSGDAPLAPYEGYWLYAFADCTLEVSAP